MKEYTVEYECSITQRVLVKIKSESVENVEALAYEKIISEWNDIRNELDLSATFQTKFIGIKSELGK